MFSKPLLPPQYITQTDIDDPPAVMLKVLAGQVPCSGKTAIWNPWIMTLGKPASQSQYVLNCRPNQEQPALIWYVMVIELVDGISKNKYLCPTPILLTVACDCTPLDNVVYGMLQSIPLNRAPHGPHMHDVGDMQLVPSLHGAHDGVIPYEIVQLQLIVAFFLVVVVKSVTLRQRIAGCPAVTGKLRYCVLPMYIPQGSISIRLYGFTC